MQAEQEAAGPDAVGRRRQSFVASAFGRGWQHIRMTHVITAVDPAGEHHRGPIDFQIFVPVFRTLSGFIKGESQGHVLFTV